MKRKIDRIIYKTTNNINGKIYVGQSLYNDNSYFGSGKILKQAIKKHGKKNFTKVILKHCKTNKELNKQEIFWIEKLNSRNLSVGYNITKGGNNYNFKTTIKNRSGKSYTEIYGKERVKEIRKHQCNAQTKTQAKRKGKSYEEIYGKEKATKIKYKQKSAHQKSLLDRCNGDAKKAEQWRKSISKGLSGEKHYLYGKHPTKQTRKKMSISNKSHINKGKTIIERYGEKNAKDIIEKSRKTRYINNHIKLCNFAKTIKNIPHHRSINDDTKQKIKDLYFNKKLCIKPISIMVKKHKTLVKDIILETVKQQLDL